MTTVASPAPTVHRHRFSAMATEFVLDLCGPGPGATAAVASAQQLVERVERSCTRFDPASALMRANVDPQHWHEVPVELFSALRAAEVAHRVSEGRFDPRVLGALQALGYDVTFTDVEDDCALDPAGAPPGRDTASPATRRPWRPRFDTRRRSVRIGRSPVDLGGIGKGLSVTWAARLLAPHAASVLVSAGGDVQTVGDGPDGAGWSVGVEDPAGGADPVAVLQLRDGAVATSSTRLRRWRRAGRDVHHLVDPRTGLSADTGLVAVTVVDAEASAAEVWTKALFIEGRGAVREYADRLGIAALWVDDRGWVGTSRAMKPFVAWQRDPAQAVTAGR
jgi:thiamine biosynthesis lipoprotein